MFFSIQTSFNFNHSPSIPYHPPNFSSASSSSLTPLSVSLSAFSASACAVRARETSAESDVLGSTPRMTPSRTSQVRRADFVDW